MAILCNFSGAYTEKKMKKCLTTAKNILDGIKTLFVPLGKCMFNQKRFSFLKSPIFKLYECWL